MKSEGKVSKYEVLHLSANNKSAFEKNKELERLKGHRDILSANFMLKLEGGSLQGCSNEFVTKFEVLSAHPNVGRNDWVGNHTKQKITSYAFAFLP